MPFNGADRMGKSLFIFGFGSLIIGVVSWIIVRDLTTKTPSEEKYPLPVGAGVWVYLGSLRNPQTWFYGAYGFFMYIPLSGFADLWGVPYITQAL